SVEVIAQRICDVMLTIPGVDLTAIDAFMGPDEVIVIGGRLPGSFPISPGDVLPPDRAAYMHLNAARGPWTERWPSANASRGWNDAMAASGVVASAFGPIVHGDHVAGILAIGTTDPRSADLLVEQMPGLVAFSATASGLLAERIHARREAVEERRRLAGVIERQAFRPVFQPIVDIASGVPVAYEALTRFESGELPDRCFRRAWQVGIGPELELATLRAALGAATRLPATVPLHVNASARLIEDGPGLRDVLAGLDRPVVLEITEHDPVAEYSSLRAKLRELGPNVGVAVDDAGAGVANFGHIVELRPDAVKLDVSMVRGISADLGRQALVVGLAHFSGTAGCSLIAEGVETDEDAATLASLGVRLGQGFRWAAPSPVDELLPGPPPVEVPQPIAPDSAVSSGGR
ncbi:MAG TPA: EAL domain-containing protein, partial [Candidatus Dormibacteraeota bacterium]|nr:EAL domain-containing protein [Candidatus Dormibacteraeota bacterium]